ncbi:universal stress protein [Pseudonocardia sp. KRD-184]|uniref:Universal stress protein n=1 Tax=Pseudonocardia oceani TaxID=2792013 RepID=A0ABS6UHM8_9PSEU|nr:universal stress protein [Pseudonocardia oceani]MBW0090759.1 universal stress protein [Pseudonocardia oceani]MBW0097936.1 universal stress protein [Pseudonocardia oceani]MBW0110426.1 universal stress protein [Pseudonocardia oceani]MBW0122068.1 universal stress protein [Pseudonocardia oceani]MBW0131740.1 universal stress protein [Pseudonocardia oceani]
MDGTRTERSEEVGEATVREVVVGADGTPTGLQAVAWAATEARVRGAALRIVHATPYATGRSAQDRAEAILGRAFTVARRHEPRVRAVTARSEQDVATALAEASRGADLLVVGRLSGHPGDAVVPSLAPAIAVAAHCPVTVVRTAPGSARTGDRPVVVGVQQAERDAPVLEAAFADASRHGCPLVVLHAHGAVGGGGTAAAPDHALDPWRQRYPDVPVEFRTGDGGAAAELLHLSVGARMVVVGTRGRGAAAAAVLGSTSRTLLQHADCPVTVVHRTGPDRQTVSRDGAASSTGTG